MINLIRADLYKMRKSKTFQVLIGLTLFCALGMIMIAYLIPKGKISDSYTGIGFLLSDVNMISIVGAVVAGVFICGDFENKSIHDSIASGINRSTVLISKSIVFLLAICFLLLPYAMLSIIAISTGYAFDMGSVSVGFLNLLTQEAGIDFRMDVLFKLLIVAVTLIIAYLAQLSICIPLALIFKKPVAVVAINYILTILCAQLLGFRKNSKEFDQIISLTPFGGDYNLLTMDASSGDIGKAIIVSILFISIIFLLTFIKFRKSEIK